jgi:aminoglycoside phosphotransferase (APT) family kinase protein
MRMHSDQLHVDVNMVRRLIDEQFAQWRDRPLSAVVAEGTVNAIFRIGDNLCARFPLQGEDADQVRKLLEAQSNASRELASCSPFATPAPVALGDPGHGFPLPWSVQTWIPGQVADANSLAGSSAFAEDLATLIRALRGTDTRGRRFSGAGRGGSFPDHDGWMDTCFRESEKLLDVDRLRRLWAEFRQLPEAGADVMCHGDLIPANLLVHDGRLVGVLDDGGFGPADPSLDLVAAWHLFDAEAREVLRQSLGCGRIEWSRGQAWAFVQAMGLVWYYRESNPGMSELGRSTLSRILDDARP